MHRGRAALMRSSLSAGLAPELGCSSNGTSLSTALLSEATKYIDLRIEKYKRYYTCSKQFLMGKQDVSCCPAGRFCIVLPLQKWRIFPQPLAGKKYHLPALFLNCTSTVTYCTNSDSIVILTSGNSQTEAINNIASVN